jgi:hypothetical protein
MSTDSWELNNEHLEQGKQHGDTFEVFLYLSLMLGLILLYFAGKAYYDLAGTHGKSKWTFAIIGVVSYYAGLLVGGIAIGVVYEIISPGSVEETNEMLLGIMAIPLGVLTCWGLYKMLQSSWSKARKRAMPEGILDAELPSEGS